MKRQIPFSKIPSIVLVLALFLVSSMSACVGPNSLNPNDTSANDGSMKTFSSLAELEAFLETADGNNNYGGTAMLGARMESATLAMDSDVSVKSAPMIADASVTNEGNNVGDDYSTTNVQVENVDEADILKTDGEYIYYVANNKVQIISAKNAEDAKILSEIQFSEGGYISQIFINGDKLIVLGREQAPVVKTTDDTDATASSKMVADIGVGRMMPYPYRQMQSVVKTYDVSNHAKPELQETISLEGNYFDSRMVGDTVYVVINKYLYDGFTPPIIYYGAGMKTIQATDISYIRMPDSSYELSIILAIDTTDNSFEEKTILKGSSQDMYVSENNIYLVSQKQVSYQTEQTRILDEVMMDYLPSEVKLTIVKIRSYDLRDSTKLSEIQFEIQKYISSLDYDEQQKLYEDMQDDIEQIQTEIAKEREKTVITRIAIDGLDMNYEATGEVAGRVLNQFSMDEFDGYFRIATTTGSSWDEKNPQVSHVYVLDMDLDVVGSVTDLAPKERIYSARFMGEKLYLVTYRNVDPLFVIDLSNPKEPEVLGKLKIPGFSNYLHPYDETHIIGIGKDTEEAKEEEGRSKVLGLQMALFDVSDVEHPKQVAKVTLGDRGTDSPVLWDHKAFLFDKEKELLVLPLRLAKIDTEKYSEDQMDWAYGDTVFQGVYVYSLNLEDGFVKRGEITHVDPEVYNKSGYYFYSNSEIDRSLYIGNALYTFSDTNVQAHDLDSFDELVDIELKQEADEHYPEPYVLDSVNADDSAEVAIEE